MAVDLDTVMPGTVLHDIGELLRIATSHAPEDAAEPSAVDFDLLDAVATGFIPGIGEHLMVPKVDALALAGPWLAVENGVRFLTDDLDGDHCFGVDRRDQNLDWARTQLSLTRLMLERLDDLAARFDRAARR